MDPWELIIVDKKTKKTSLFEIEKKHFISTMSQLYLHFFYSMCQVLMCVRVCLLDSTSSKFNKFGEKWNNKYITCPILLTQLHILLPNLSWKDVYNLGIFNFERERCTTN